MKTKLNRVIGLALGSLLLASVAMPAFSHPGPMYSPFYRHTWEFPPPREEPVWVPGARVDRDGELLHVPGYWRHYRAHWIPDHYVRFGHRIFFVPGRWER